MLTEMRAREGEALQRDLTARLLLVAGFLEEISGRAPQVVLEYQKRLGDRIRELTGGLVIDDARLLQEVAIMAERSDITEEIVRFRSHIDQFTDLLGTGDGAGRKIDFLIQEMGREVNTIGSKSGDAEISRSVIEIKSELAKLRHHSIFCTCSRNFASSLLISMTLREIPASPLLEPIVLISRPISWIRKSIFLPAASSPASRSVN